MIHAEGIDRKGTDSEKWEKYAGTDIIPMWVADMDFKAPDCVISALHKRVDHGVFGYTRPPNDLAEILTERLFNLYKWKVSPEWIVYLPGLVTGIHVTCLAACREGAAVLTHVPVYPPFLSAPRQVNRKLQTFAMIKEKNRWVIDFDSMEASVTPQTELLLLCSPHNPTGRIFDRKELEKLASFCERHGLIICSDEIHCDLIIDQTKKHIPTASLSSEIAKRTITLMAPSKTFNIPGLGFSFAVIPSDTIRRRFTKTMRGIVPHVNALGYTAALAAYRHGQKWLAETLDLLRFNHHIVLEKIKQIPGLSTTPAEATYLSWIDTSVLPVEDYADFFEKAGVGLSCGQPFGGKGFLRLNFACPPVLLREAFDRIEYAVNRLKNE